MCAIPPPAMKRLRLAAAWTSGGYRAAMCTTLCFPLKPSQHLVYMLKSSPTILCVRDHPLLTKRIERSWQLLLRRFAKAPVKQSLGFYQNVIAILLELGWKPLSATHWISDLEDTWTFDLTQTFDLVPTVTGIERASRRHLWKAASLHRNGESFAAATPDRSPLKRS